MKVKDLVEKLKEVDQELYVHAVDELGEMLYDSICNVRQVYVNSDKNINIIEVVILES